MTFELFGTSPMFGVEYLGSFINETHALEALDQYAAMGYSNLKLSRWTVR